MSRDTQARLLRAVRAHVPAGAKVLAAVSGGADSTALLLLLHTLAQAGEIRLAAAHFEHGIRGEESLGDMRFVQDLCGRLGVECFCARADVPAEARRRRMGLEETAREMRRAFLEEARRKTGADLIALAHHRDDQAETVLMHLFRGGGVSGAAAMRARTGVWLRPLLEIGREELRAYLRDQGISWREDATNAEGCTPRNRLRGEVMPAVEEIWPGATKALGRYAAIAARESDFCERAAAGWIENAGERHPYGLLLRLDGKPHEAVLARAVKRLCGQEAEYTDVERVLALVEAERGAFVPRGAAVAEIRRGPEGLWFLNGLEPPRETPLRLDGETAFGAVGAFSAGPWEKGPIRGDPSVQALSAAALEGASARPWREGDRIRPLGMGGKSRLLSDLYGEKGVPAAARRYMPVVVRGEDILWAVGAAIAEEAKLGPGEAAVRVAWRENGE